MADTASTSPVTETTQGEETDHRERPASTAFRDFMASGWPAESDQLPGRLAAAEHAQRRRHELGAAFPGVRVIVPAGVLQVRSNDCDYLFRPHSAFAYYTAQGWDAEPDQVLILEPLTGPDGTAEAGPTHAARLYFRPRAGRDTKEFYADARYGELWVGVRPSSAEIHDATGIEVRHLDECEADATAGDTPIAIIGEANPRLLAVVDAARAEARVSAETAGKLDAELLRFAGEHRMIKDDYEVGQLELACEVTARGFEDVVRALPSATDAVRGERVVETAFNGRARREGNDVGYSTIAASGNHACTLHWVRNDGPVRDGDLILVDAGVEVDSLYTADVTRTLPVNGRFTDAQREIYNAVLEAADAAFAVAKPGSKFRDLNEAAMQVIARKVHEWGFLPDGVTVEQSLAKEGQFHRRWMVHGTSHHLGLDVHDCSAARRDMYLEAELVPGMVFTIEPGLYFRADDELVPPEFRGNAVRIEDDVLLTEHGCRNLSSMLPRSAEDIEKWMAQLWAS